MMVIPASTVMISEVSRHCLTNGKGQNELIRQYVIDEEDIDKQEQEVKVI